MKRVVVTGMGAVTPVGNSVGEFWTSLINGVNGIEEITRFDTTDSKYRFAAEVKNWDPLAVIDKTTVRKTDPVHAVCALRRTGGGGRQLNIGKCAE